VEAETTFRGKLKKFWNNFKENAKDVFSPPTIAGVPLFLPFFV
jgi:hypothetical protein